MIMQANNSTITIDDLFRYVDYLSECVEYQLSKRQDRETESILFRLKLLLGEGHICKFVDGLTKRKVNIPAYHKIVEIDDSLDELYLKQLALPYPQEVFAKDQRKSERTQRMTMMILVLGLCGFEWVIDSR